MEIRQAQISDLYQLLTLYTQLHGNSMPEFDEKLHNLWTGILENRNHHVIVGTASGLIVSSCVLVVVPNLTRNQRPCAFIENVITHKEHRNKGYATRLLNYAGDIATKENCYKIMLMTGSKEDRTLKFYENAGYNRNDKTAFIRWLV